MMSGAPEPPTQDNLKDAPIDRRGKPKNISCIELPARIEVGIDTDGQLMLLLLDRVEMRNGPPGTIIFNPISPDLADLIAELEVRRPDRPPSGVRPHEGQVHHGV